MLRALVAAEKPRVVHVHTEANYLLTMATLRRPVRRAGGILVRTVHSMFLARGRWRMSRRVQAAIADRWAAAVVGPSPDVVANESRNRRTLQLVYPWVDDRIFEIAGVRASAMRRPTDASRILLVGNCSEIKDHELALRAILPTRHVVAHLGDESTASEQERGLLARLADDGRLVARGAMPPDSNLVAADVFALPSALEGASVALAEAIVASIPALVAEAPGLSWARGLPGVQMVARDDRSWREAVATCAELATHPSSPVHLDFSARRGAEEYLAIYRRGLAAAGGPSS
jgi:hypothetical protein